MHTLKIVYFINFCFGLLHNSHSDQFQCNVCTCYYAEPTTFADCSSTGLDSLPVLELFIVDTLNMVDLANNRIVTLDQDVLDTWILLEYIDLRGNHINCSELVKIDPSVKIFTDCTQPTQCKYSYLNLFLSLTSPFRFLQELCEKKIKKNIVINKNKINE